MLTFSVMWLHFSSKLLLLKSFRVCIVSSLAFLSLKLVRFHHLPICITMKTDNVSYFFWDSWILKNTTVVALGSSLKVLEFYYSRDRNLNVLNFSKVLDIRQPWNLLFSEIKELNNSILENIQSLIKIFWGIQIVDPLVHWGLVLVWLCAVPEADILSFCWLLGFRISIKLVTPSSLEP